MHVPYVLAHVDIRARTSLSFSIRAADIRFHEGHIPCNQTLGPNGFRRVHIVVAVVILTAVSRSRRSNERDALPRCVSKFHDCYNEMSEIFVWKAICCRKSCRPVFHGTRKLLIFQKNVLRRLYRLKS